MIIVFCFMSLIVSCHSTVIENPSTQVCPESFNCSSFGTFQYPFYNTTNTRCGLINVNCTSKGGEIKIGGRWYEIVDKSESHNEVLINDTAFDHLVKRNNCRALMNNFTSLSPSPLLYTITIFPLLTLFKCTKNNLISAQHTDTYFKQHNYNSYNQCEDHNFYYKYLNEETLPSELTHTCQLLQLPAKVPTSEHNQTDIFSLLTSLITISFKLTRSCGECHEKDGQCADKNGVFQCLDAKKEKLNGGMTRARKLLILVLGVGSGAILFLLILCLKRKTQRRKLKEKYNVKVEMFLKNHQFLAPKRYSYSQVEKMTDSFKVKLGQGGFGVVYKGVLRNQTQVAVKVLSKTKGDGEDFINEVASVGRTSHVNIVSLLGFCLNGRHRALIYEFMSNGSLERFIYGHDSSYSSQLGWEKLHQIAIGIARGLEYLYRGCSTRILHFDIKPHNILLDNDFCPKISDFGLAKLFREKESKISISHMRGTPGYIAPELFSRNFGEVSHKSDVYSYGMMILEMVGGRKNIDVGVDHTSEIYFPHWIYKKLELHEEQLGLHGIVSDEESRIARKMIIVGLWCIQTNPLNRPTITNVLEMLEGDLESLKIPPKPYISSPSRRMGSPSTDSMHLYCSTIS